MEMSARRQGNFLGPIGRWLKEEKAELKKVVWPPYAKVQQNTIIVLISILLIGIIIWAFDYVFLQAVTAVLGTQG